MEPNFIFLLLGHSLGKSHLLQPLEFYLVSKIASNCILPENEDQIVPARYRFQNPLKLLVAVLAFSEWEARHLNLHPHYS